MTLVDKIELAAWIIGALLVAIILAALFIPPRGGSDY